MNKFELEEAVKAYQQKSFNEWLRISLISGAIIAVIVAFINLYQGINYLRLSWHNQTRASQIHELNTSLENAEEKIKKYELVKKQHLLICQKKKPSDYLNAISKAIPEQTLLTQLSMTPESLTFSGFTLNAEQLAQFMTALSTTSLGNSKLISSTPEAAGLRFTINA